MKKTTMHAVTFGGVTYGVEGIPIVDIDGVEHLGISTSVLAKVEEAIALAALTDGCRDPEALRFARKAIGHSVGQTAYGFAIDPSNVRAWESGATPIDPAHVADFVAMLYQRDRGGFVARRVTV